MWACHIPDARRPEGMAIGVNEAGSFRTSALRMLVKANSNPGLSTQMERRVPVMTSLRNGFLKRQLCRPAVSGLTVCRFN